MRGSYLLFSSLFLFVLSFTAGPRASASDMAGLSTANRLLNAEYELARTSKIYFVFDLPQGQVLIKANGVAVHRLPFVDARVWGAHGEEKVLSLASRETLFPPQRDQVLPTPEEAEKAKTKPAKFELNALELEDMPKSFHLYLDDGTRISVFSQSPGKMARIPSTLHTSWHVLTRPLISGWHLLRRKPYTEVQLILAEQDARRIYWSFTEGTHCFIIWTPPAGG